MNPRTERVTARPRLVAAPTQHLGREPRLSAVPARLTGTQATPELVRGLSQYVSTVTAQATRTPWPDAPGRKVYGNSHQPQTKGPPAGLAFGLGIACLAALVVALAYIPKKAEATPDRAIYSLDTGERK